MTRPHIVRADSIDLQDHGIPSAQDHTFAHSSHANAGGVGSKAAANGNSTTSSNSTTLGAHQAETLREVAAEAAEENLRSPRVSWNGGEVVGDLQLQQYAEDLAAGVANSLGGLNNNKMSQQQDNLALAQNGGTGSGTSPAQQQQHAGESNADADGDEDMDDDMMDKISSSPSIEDGGYPFSRNGRRWDEALPAASPPIYSFSSSPGSAFSEAMPVVTMGLPDSSLHLAAHLFNKTAFEFNSRHHHLLGEYNNKQARIETGSEPRPPNLDDNSNGDRRGLNNKEEAGESGRSTDTDEFWSDAVEFIDEDRDSDRYTLVQTDTASTITTDPDYHDDHERQAILFGLTIPYESSEDDDDCEFLCTDERYIDYGWGIECLQDSEDIDFEFVYALHTFVATVEGQANATKGDTMVLLDDSNSYWWLVRVVKDSSIGYLPAEHIETPTERLARLNKHRNIDLSATMLGDQADKAKNGLKIGIRRRKAKTVTFAAPTYVDYSDIEYSTDEDDLEAEFLAQQQAAREAQQQQAAAQQNVADEDVEDDSAKVEPLKPRAQQKEAKIEPATVEDAEDADVKDARVNEEVLEAKVTRNGTVRNTDSFFKDDTVETKKITLTPNLLRDDNTPRASTDSKELRQRPSLDRLDKDLLVDRSKDKKLKDKDRKDKDKKPSVIRNFFSRKDKKRSPEDDEESLGGKRSMDMAFDSQEKDLDDLSQYEDQPSSATIQRVPSKLQKQQPRIEPVLTRKNSVPTTPSTVGVDIATYLSDAKPNNVSNVPPASMRVVDSDVQDMQNGYQRGRNGSTDRQADDKASAYTNGVRTVNGDVKSQKVVKATSRMDLDYDDEDMEEVVPEQQTRQVRDDNKKQPQQRPTLPGAFPDSYVGSQSDKGSVKTTTLQQQQDRLSESPVQVSPSHSSNPPALMVDTSSQEGHSSPTSSSPSPELLGLDGEDEMGGAGMLVGGGRHHRNQDSMTTSTSAATTNGTAAISAWNDASLRAFFDSGTDIRDLLVVVYDKSDVSPAGPEHPVAGTLFREQNAKLAEITTQLDNMLGDWLARKQRLRGTV